MYGFHVGYGCGVNYRKILRVNNMLYYFLGCLCSILSDTHKYIKVYSSLDSNFTNPKFLYKKPPIEIVRLLIEIRNLKKLRGSSISNDMKVPG